MQQLPGVWSCVLVASRCIWQQSQSNISRQGQL